MIEFFQCFSKKLRRFNEHIGIFTDCHCSRSQKRRNGCSPKIERPKRKNRFDGFGAGHQVMSSRRNSTNCNVKVNVRNRVNRVPNKMFHVHIRCQRCVKNSPNWSANKHWNRLQLSWVCLCWHNSPVFLRCVHLLCKFFRPTIVQSNRIERPPLWAYWTI